MSEDPPHVGSLQVERSARSAEQEVCGSQTIGVLISPNAMHALLARRHPIVLSVLAGSAAGFVYAQYHNVLAFARVGERCNWVCGTGLQDQAMVFTSAGAVLGAVLALVAVGLYRRLVRKAI